MTYYDDNDELDDMEEDDDSEEYIEFEIKTISYENYDVEYLPYVYLGYLAYPFQVDSILQYDMCLN